MRGRRWKGIFFILDAASLRKAIMQEPLLEREASLAGTAKLALPANLFFGIGLCNRHALSCGMPADVLRMVAISEKIGGKKTILIADAHAKFNGFGHKEIDRVAHMQQDTLQGVCGKLGLRNWEIVLASDIIGNPAYQSILRTINEENEYVRKELADIWWMRQERGVMLKVGWALNGSRNSSETFFDGKFSSGKGGEMSFIYVESGRTFDPAKPRAPPYFCDNPQNRMLLKAGENAQAKIAKAREVFGEAGVNRGLNHLKLLVRVFEGMAGTVERGQAHERIQAMLDRCLP